MLHGQRPPLGQVAVKSVQVGRMIKDICIEILEFLG